MSIKFGHCKEYHESVAEVRDCSSRPGMLGARMGEAGTDVRADLDEIRSRSSEPSPEIAEPKPEVNLEGMHKVGDVIYKVQRAVHGSGHPYAKQLVLTEPDCGGCANGEPCGAGCTWTATFEYARGAIRLLSEQTKMTLEEAKEFGALYGTCCVCGRTLTKEESIEAGIGPVCAQKF
jgi:hypothetical protein